MGLVAPAAYIGLSTCCNAAVFIRMYRTGLFNYACTKCRTVCGKVPKSSYLDWKATDYSSDAIAWCLGGYRKSSQICKKIEYTLPDDPMLYADNVPDFRDFKSVVSDIVSRPWFWEGVCIDEKFLKPSKEKKDMSSAKIRVQRLRDLGLKVDEYGTGNVRVGYEGGASYFLDLTKSATDILHTVKASQRAARESHQNYSKLYEGLIEVLSRPEMSDEKYDKIKRFLDACEGTGMYSRNSPRFSREEIENVSRFFNTEGC